MPPLVSVLTPTIPGREHLLAENRLAFRAQTHRSAEHIVALDVGGDGCAKTMNRAAKLARGEWYLPIGDDDFLCPGGLATLLSAADGADVVFSPPLVWNEPNPEQFCLDPPNIPACALVRASFWRDAGGYNETIGDREDYDLWERLMQRGARFVRVESAPTWVYRFHWLEDGSPGNKSRR